MTAKRDASFSLDDALSDPGFTPRVRDLRALLERVTGEDAEVARRAAAAVVRIQDAVAAPIAATLAAQPAEAAAELAAAAALRPGAKAAEVATLVAALAGAVASPSATRSAAAGLARVLGDQRARRGVDADALDAVVSALVTALAVAEGPTRRAVARGLAAAATPAARAALASADAGGDAVVSRARLASQRDAARDGVDDAPHLDRVPVSPLAAILICRRGLEAIVAAQAGAPREARPTRAGRVAIVLAGSPAAALDDARSALGIGFPLPPEPLPADGAAAPEAVAEAVARALVAPVARAVLERFAAPRVRFRVSFAGGGKHRATAWAIAERAAAIGDGTLVNDPRDAPWELVVGLPPVDAASRRGDPFVELELRPRFDDRRFPWRVADVPAASHPTIAAAIAHLGGAVAGDVVWDPFVGSGGELCERARMSPRPSLLIGTDIDEAALVAARRNLTAGGLDGRLHRTDALDFVPAPPATLILSNPPMGRRVLRGEGDVRRLLVEVIGRTPRTLAPGGRLVFASAHPEDTREAAHAAGLELLESTVVDLGGFDVELQSFRRGG